MWGNGTVFFDFYFETFVDFSLGDGKTITDNTGCINNPNGNITLAPVNGTAPYSYAWTCLLYTSRCV